MFSLSSTALMASLISSAAAHSYITAIVTSDGSYGGWDVNNPELTWNETNPTTPEWHAINVGMGPVYGYEVGSPDIICHRQATSSQHSASAPAGSTVGLMWHKWDPSHLGPAMTYIAPCNGDCATVDKTTLSWVKFDEDGYTDGKWGNQKLFDTGSVRTITIPAGLAPGGYVIRQELLALHNTTDFGGAGAQFFPYCVNFQVTGDGTGKLPQGTIGTKLYNENDQGVNYNLWVPDKKDYSQYVVPGPSLWDGKFDGQAASSSTGAGSSAAAKPASAAPASSSAVAAAAAASSPKSAVSTAIAATVQPEQEKAAAVPTTMSRVVVSQQQQQQPATTAAPAAPAVPADNVEVVTDYETDVVIQTRTQTAWGGPHGQWHKRHH